MKIITTLTLQHTILTTHPTQTIGCRIRPNIAYRWQPMVLVPDKLFGFTCVISHGNVLTCQPVYENIVWRHKADLCPTCCNDTTIKPVGIIHAALLYISAITCQTCIKWNTTAMTLTFWYGVIQVKCHVSFFAQCLTVCNSPHFSVGPVCDGLSGIILFFRQMALVISLWYETSNHDTNSHGIMRTTKPVIKFELHGQLGYCSNYSCHAIRI